MMTDRSPNPALKSLEFLVGDWKMILSNAAFIEDPGATVESVASVEWVKQGAFLLLTQGDDTSSPFAYWLIGRDESKEEYSVFYLDDRGISRIYQMSFDGTTWKLWRAAPGFEQRFTAEVSQNGQQISGHWEKSEIGQAWQHDFDLTYQRKA